mmetsp:Transcript_15234/g.21398  ORF Transcript_15234/g.21398 Transcript_15234/m.21398 type:complete len:364 (-) Transcript_15234:238-1329(-)
MSWQNFGGGSGGSQRSSTRRINPPGGRSNFSIGGYGDGGGAPDVMPQGEWQPRDESGSGSNYGASGGEVNYVRGNVSQGRDARVRERSARGGPSQVHFGGDTAAPPIGGGGYRGAIPLAGNGPPSDDPYQSQGSDPKLKYEDYFNTKKSSTRRIEPPGGSSNLDLGGYPEEKEQPRRLSRRMDARHQNDSLSPADPPARSHSFSQAQRSSTRRLAPPGGQSNISLGWNGSQAGPASSRSRSAVRRKSSRDYENKVSVGRRPTRHGRKQAHPISATDKVALEGKAHDARARLLHREGSLGTRGEGGGSGDGNGNNQPWDRPMASSSNAYASNSRQNSGNFITNRPSTKVHAPPGGGSSLSLGWG